MKPQAKPLLYFIFIYIFSINLSFPEERSTWLELKGGHFIIYFEKDEVMAKDILDKAELYYKEIADDLSYARHSKFWLWEDRVKIYIFPDRISYLSSTRQPEWSGGFADYNNKQIITYRSDKEFLDSFLPHEIAHLILRDYIGFNPEIPLWVDEGVAQWAEAQKRKETEKRLKHIIEEKKLIPLHKFTKMDIRAQRNPNLVELYYMQSASLVGFLIEKYGLDTFIELCRNLRDGKSLKDALRLSTSSKIKDLDELEKEWIKHVLVKNVEEGRSD